MKINQRLRIIREETGYSQARFAKEMGLPQSTYAQYELEKRAVPDELKIKLSEKYHINIHWLVTGEGAMFLGDDGAEGRTGVVEICQPPKGYTYITTKGEPITIEYPDWGLSVPVLAQKLSAGPGQEWSQDDMVSGERLPIISRFIKPWSKEKIYAAEVRGDSMTKIELFDGDIVFFVRGEINGEGIYVLTVDNQVYVKRVSFNPFTKEITIKSENDRYEPVTVQQDRVSLLGKVIGWLHHHPY